MEKQIIDILEIMRPYLQNDGGDLEFIKYEDNIVYIKLIGNCDGCAISDFTVKGGIEAMLVNEIPEIKGVIAI